ncbi:hypothetical protein Tco_0371304 [Tanacetum coccineum]
MGEGSTIPTDPHHTPTFIQPSTQPSDPIKNVTDEAVHKELGDSLVRAATTASSLEAKQDNVLDVEKTKTTQHNEIASLKRRVKKLEKKDRSITHRLKRLQKVGLTAREESSDNEESLGEDASKQGRIDAIDADEEITLVSVHDVNVFAGEEVFVAEEDVVEVINTAKLIIDTTTIVSAATTTTSIIKTVDDITLAQALEEIKSTKPKKKGVVIQELDQIIRVDEETALNLQAEFDEEERLAREKAKKEEEANIALIETWDDMQVKIDVGHQLAERIVGERKRKKAGTELIQEITKKQKVDDDKETTELKQLMKIIPNEEEVAIDVIPLVVYQMLKSFDMEDLEDLYKWVKAKYESTTPVEDLDLLLGIYMLVEKKYPLASLTLSMMLEKKLIIDHESEMAYQFPKFIIKQLKK